METIIKNKVDSFLQENQTLSCIKKSVALAIIRPDIESELDRCIDVVFSQYQLEEDELEEDNDESE